MLRRNVKVTPLPGLEDVEALDVLARVPEMYLISSVHPHFEGNPDPINLYGSALSEFDDDVRDRLLGANAAEAFARTGDQLPSPDNRRAHQ